MNGNDEKGYIQNGTPIETAAAELRQGDDSAERLVSLVKAVINFLPSMNFSKASVPVAQSIVHSLLRQLCELQQLPLLATAVERLYHQMDNQRQLFDFLIALSMNDFNISIPLAYALMSQGIMTPQANTAFMWLLDHLVPVVTQPDKYQNFQLTASTVSAILPVVEHCINDVSRKAEQNGVNEMDAGFHILRVFEIIFQYWRNYTKDPMAQQVIAHVDNVIMPRIARFVARMPGAQPRVSPTPVGSTTLLAVQQFFNVCISNGPVLPSQMLYRYFVALALSQVSADFRDYIHFLSLIQQYISQPQYQRSLPPQLLQQRQDVDDIILGSRPAPNGPIVPFRFLLINDLCSAQALHLIYTAAQSGQLIVNFDEGFIPLERVRDLDSVTAQELTLKGALGDLLLSVSYVSTVAKVAARNYIPKVLSRQQPEVLAHQQSIANRIIDQMIQQSREMFLYNVAFYVEGTVVQYCEKHQINDNFIETLRRMVFSDHYGLLKSCCADCFSHFINLRLKHQSDARTFPPDRVFYIMHQNPDGHIDTHPARGAAQQVLGAWFSDVLVAACNITFSADPNSLQFVASIATRFGRTKDMVTFRPGWSSPPAGSVTLPELCQQYLMQTSLARNDYQSFVVTFPFEFAIHMADTTKGGLHFDLLSWSINQLMLYGSRFVVALISFFQQKLVLTEQGQRAAQKLSVNLFVEEYAAALASTDRVKTAEDFVAAQSMDPQACEAEKRSSQINRLTDRVLDVFTMTQLFAPVIIMHRVFVRPQVTDPVLAERVKTIAGRFDVVYAAVYKCDGFDHLLQPTISPKQNWSAVTNRPQDLQEYADSLFRLIATGRTTPTQPPSQELRSLPLQMDENASVDFCLQHRNIQSPVVRTVLNYVLMQLIHTSNNSEYNTENPPDNYKRLNFILIRLFTQDVLQSTVLCRFLEHTTCVIPLAFKQANCPAARHFLHLCYELHAFQFMLRYPAFAAALIVQVPQLIKSPLIQLAQFFGHPELTKEMSQSLPQTPLSTSPQPVQYGQQPPRARQAARSPPPQEREAMIKLVVDMIHQMLNLPEAAPEYVGEMRSRLNNLTTDNAVRTVEQLQPLNQERLPWLVSELVRAAWFVSNAPSILAVIDTMKSQGIDIADQFLSVSAAVLHKLIRESRPGINMEQPICSLTQLLVELTLVRGRPLLVTTIDLADEVQFLVMSSKAELVAPILNIVFEHLPLQGPFGLLSGWGSFLIMLMIGYSRIPIFGPRAQALAANLAHDILTKIATAQGIEQIMVSMAQQSLNDNDAPGALFEVLNGKRGRPQTPTEAVQFLSRYLGTSPSDLAASLRVDFGPVSLTPQTMQGQQSQFQALVAHVTELYAQDTSQKEALTKMIGNPTRVTGRPPLSNALDLTLRSSPIIGPIGETTLRCAHPPLCLEDYTRLTDISVGYVCNIKGQVEVSVPFQLLLSLGYSPSVLCPLAESAAGYLTNNMTPLFVDGHVSPLAEKEFCMHGAKTSLVPLLVSAARDPVVKRNIAASAQRAVETAVVTATAILRSDCVSFTDKDTVLSYYSTITRRAALSLHAAFAPAYLRSVLINALNRVVLIPRLQDGSRQLTAQQLAASKLGPQDLAQVLRPLLLAFVERVVNEVMDDESVALGEAVFAALRNSTDFNEAVHSRSFAGVAENLNLSQTQALEQARQHHGTFIGIDKRHANELVRVPAFRRVPPELSPGLPAMDCFASSSVSIAEKCKAAETLVPPPLVAANMARVRGFSQILSDVDSALSGLSTAHDEYRRTQSRSMAALSFVGSSIPQVTQSNEIYAVMTQSLDDQLAVQAAGSGPIEPILAEQFVRLFVGRLDKAALLVAERLPSSTYLSSGISSLPASVAAPVITVTNSLVNVLQRAVSKQPLAVTTVQMLLAGARQPLSEGPAAPWLIQKIHTLVYLHALRSIIDSNGPVCDISQLLVVNPQDFSADFWIECVRLGIVSVPVIDSIVSGTCERCLDSFRSYYQQLLALKPKAAPRTTGSVLIVDTGKPEYAVADLFPGAKAYKNQTEVTMQNTQGLVITQDPPRIPSMAPLRVAAQVVTGLVVNSPLIQPRQLSKVITVLTNTVKNGLAPANLRLSGPLTAPIHMPPSAVFAVVRDVQLLPTGAQDVPALDAIINKLPPQSFISTFNTEAESVLRAELEALPQETRAECICAVLRQWYRVVRFGRDTSPALGMHYARLCRALGVGLSEASTTAFWELALERTRQHYIGVASTALRPDTQQPRQADPQAPRMQMPLADPQLYTSALLSLVRWSILLVPMDSATCGIQRTSITRCFLGRLYDQLQHHCLRTGSQPTTTFKLERPSFNARFWYLLLSGLIADIHSSRSLYDAGSLVPGVLVEADYKEILPPGCAVRIVEHSLRATSAMALLVMRILYEIFLGGRALVNPVEFNWLAVIGEPGLIRLAMNDPLLWPSYGTMARIAIYVDLDLELYITRTKAQDGIGYFIEITEGVFRLFLVLSHDYPDFISAFSSFLYDYQFHQYIDNIIASAQPHNVRTYARISAMKRGEAAFQGDQNSLTIFSLIHFIESREAKLPAFQACDPSVNLIMRPGQEPTPFMIFANIVCAFARNGLSRGTTQADIRAAQQIVGEYFAHYSQRQVHELIRQLGPFCVFLNAGLIKFDGPFTTDDVAPYAPLLAHVIVSSPSQSVIFFITSITQFLGQPSLQSASAAKLLLSLATSGLANPIALDGPFMMTDTHDPVPKLSLLICSMFYHMAKYSPHSQGRERLQEIVNRTYEIISQSQ